MNSNEQALSARNLYNATWKLLLVYMNYYRWKMSTVMSLSFLFSSTLIFYYDPSSHFLGVRTAVFESLFAWYLLSLSRVNKVVVGNLLLDYFKKILISVL